MTGVFLDRDSLDHGDLDFTSLQATLPDGWQLHATTRPAETAARLANAEVVVSNKVVLDEAVMAAAPGSNSSPLPLPAPIMWIWTLPPAAVSPCVISAATPPLR
jgi:predicted component of type VI protein secretion system